MSIDCPERFSLCCRASSKAVTGDEGTGHFECSQCGEEYIGGKCTAAKHGFISRKTFMPKEEV